VEFAMIGKIDDALKFHQTVLSLRAQRQQMLASNIANADTPNYKARDIDFNSALKQALSAPKGGGMPGQPAKTAAAHMAGTDTNVTSTGIPLLYRSTVQGSVDGNTVDMDAERNQFVDNAVRYEAGIMFINSRIRGLLTAIQGQ
jgi:flagellar basal-body rod protein FlgB